jgi:NTE family protein
MVAKKTVPKKAAASKTVKLDLALQGGGSHGAFTWGVLDRLLQEPRVQLAGLSGTSAGALNAAVLATGYASGGAEGARTALRAFWLDVATQSSCFGAWPGAAPGATFGAPIAPNLAAFNLDANPFYAWGQAFLRSFSPYQFNPSGTNPLQAVVQRHVDAQALRKGPLALFVTATSVTTGQARVFDRQDISVDALLASACLPQIFRAVQIDGQPYWDGGYSGNPALWPLIYNTPALDVMLVKINPLVRPGTPDTAAEIADRVNEITFNAGLVSEMRAIAFVQRLLQEKRVSAGAYKNLRLHMVAGDDTLAPLHASSKLNTERAFLEGLFALGHAAADSWLLANGQHLGRRATLDPRTTFLGGRGDERA